MEETKVVIQHNQTAFSVKQRSMCLSFKFVREFINCKNICIKDSYSDSIFGKFLDLMEKGECDISASDSYLLISLLFEWECHPMVQKSLKSILLIKKRDSFIVHNDELHAVSGGAMLLNSNIYRIHVRDHPFEPFVIPKGSNG